MSVDASWALAKFDIHTSGFWIFGRFWKSQKTFSLWGTELAGRTAWEWGARHRQHVNTGWKGRIDSVCMRSRGLQEENNNTSTSLFFILCFILSYIHHSRLLKKLHWDWGLGLLPCLRLQEPSGAFMSLQELVGFSIHGTDIYTALWSFCLDLDFMRITLMS